MDRYICFRSTLASPVPWWTDGCVCICDSLCDFLGACECPVRNCHMMQADSSVLEILLAPMEQASKWKAMYAKLEDAFEARTSSGLGVDATSKKRRISHQQADTCRTSGHDRASCASLNPVLEVCKNKARGGEEKKRLAELEFWSLSRPEMPPTSCLFID